ncbi:PRC-barrel domain-containing protein [Iamia sp.]|uniref:PRC-barrel domain-containing protein n=1 Tax=Iamia sp. TaxID=2722710 RepID=UPI002BA5746D|nr:PRC-barrel domain-containing protein [Iamia sp.]HXH58672.1 PRC-barrel domain-containing protein [Iamia sp.]
MTVRLQPLSGRSVLDLTTATTVGEVRCAALDPGAGEVAALVLKKTPGAESLLPWTAIKAIGPDAITIETRDVLVAPEGPKQERAASGDLDPLGKRTFNDMGEALGQVDDLVVDDHTGRITEIVVDGRHFDGSALIGSGGYAVIVRHVPESNPSG